jgi:protein-disulfide isomerase
VLIAAAVLTGAIAATVDGQPVMVDALDATLAPQVERLRDVLHAAGVAGVERLVGEAIASAGVPDAVAPPVSDDDVRRFRSEHPDDFERLALDPVFERAAIRHHLEERARATARAARLRDLRAARRVVIAVPDGRVLERPLLPRRKVARVDRTAIRAAALEQVAALPLYRARGELYRIRRRRLDEAIDEHFLARAGPPREPAGVLPAPVSDEELREFVDDERQAGRVIADPERVRPYLAFRKGHRARAELLDRLRAQARIEVKLEPPPVPHLPENEADAPVLGPPSARRLIVYSNYRCGPCRAVHREIDRLRADAPDIRVAFRDFVPVYDPAASEGAGLVRCAAKLGAFEAMRRMLLERDAPRFGQRWFADADLAALARSIRVDATAFAACLAAPETAATIARDSAAARALGFTEAPGLLANGVPLSGMQSAATLARALP